MKVLHILKTEPDETVKRIIEYHLKRYNVKVVRLYRKDISYSDLLKAVFEYDKVISW